MDELVVHRFQAEGEHYVIGSDQMYSFINDVAGGDSMLASHWLESAMHGELIIVGQDGPIADMFVITMPTARAMSQHLSDLEGARERHPSYEHNNSRRRKAYKGRARERQGEKMRDLMRPDMDDDGCYSNNVIPFRVVRP